MDPREGFGGDAVAGGTEGMGDTHRGGWGGGVAGVLTPPPPCRVPPQGAEGDGGQAAPSPFSRGVEFSFEAGAVRRGLGDPPASSPPLSRYRPLTNASSQEGLAGTPSPKSCHSSDSSPGFARRDAWPQRHSEGEHPPPPPDPPPPGWGARRDPGNPQHPCEGQWVTSPSSSSCRRQPGHEPPRAGQPHRGTR